MIKQQTANSRQRSILLGLTTTPGSDWREKIKEIDQFGITEIAFFPTYLGPEQREELYGLLEKSGLKKIIFVHLRPDFSISELEYLTEKYGVEFFNIHPDDPGIKFLKSAPQFASRIFIENLRDNIDDVEKNVGDCGGLCIDFAHWHAAKIDKRKSYKKFENVVKNNKIGFCHLSAILDKPEIFSWAIEEGPCLDYHTLRTLSNMDYLKSFLPYLPDILGLELENSFEEQLEIKAYVEKIINEK